MSLRIRIATGLACAVLCAGCSLVPGGGGAAAGGGAVRGGARPSTSTSAAAAVALADRTHEFPTPAPRQTVIGGWPTPVAAVKAFASTYINWTAATVSLRLRVLAAVSVGQARSAMTLAAAQTAADYELRRAGIANSGAVEAIAPVLGERDTYAVVTREQTTAAGSGAYRGLQPAWHVTLATVTEIEGGEWVLSAWQPES